MTNQSKKMMALVGSEAITNQSIRNSNAPKLKLVPKTKTALALVAVRGEKLFIDSNIMAELFGRPHKNVMRDIVNLAE